MPGIGPGIRTNPLIRSSTNSLNPVHLRATGDPTKPFVFVNMDQSNAEDNEKLRSLRSVTVKQQRPHSIAGVLESPEEYANNGESPRSLRSFSVINSREEDVSQMTAPSENRSLRSFSVRPGAAVLSLPQDNNETTRSLRSFMVRDRAVSDTSSDNGEHDRSEGTTMRPESASTLVPDQDMEFDENARSLRSISVYRN